MHRTDAEDNVDGRFTDGSAEQGRLATVIGAKWLNSVQEEIANLLEENGVVLDPENESQLAEMFAPFLAGEFEEITLSDDNTPPNFTTIQKNKIHQQKSNAADRTDVEPAKISVLSAFNRTYIEPGVVSINDLDVSASRDGSALTVSGDVVVEGSVNGENACFSGESKSSKFRVIKEGVSNNAESIIDIDSEGIVSFLIRGKETYNNKYLSFNTEDGKLTAGHNYTNDIQISQLINGLLYAQKEGAVPGSSWNNRVVVNADFDVSGNIVGDSTGGGIAVFVSSSSTTGSETRKVVISTGGLKFYEVNAAGTAWQLMYEVPAEGIKKTICGKVECGTSNAVSTTFDDGEIKIFHITAGSVSTCVVTDTNTNTTTTLVRTTQYDHVYSVCRFGNKIYTLAN